MSRYLRGVLNIHAYRLAVARNWEPRQSYAFEAAGRGERPNRYSEKERREKERRDDDYSARLTNVANVVLVVLGSENENVLI